MADKTFVGNCKPGKYPDQVDIGFKADDLNLLISSLNERGYVNLRLNKGKESGKPYLELVTPK